MSINEIVYEEGSRLASKMMELSMERQKVIANNIANVDTPGYVRKELDFEKQLADVVESRNMSELRGVKGEVVENNEGPARLDGNNVKVAKELNHMMQNSIYYQLLTKAFKTKMNILKAAIK